MVDASALHTQFSGSAGLLEQKRVYEKRLEKAGEFFQTLPTKGTLSPTAVQQGKELLQGLNDKQTDLYAFNSAVLAGQEAASDADLSTRIDQIDAAVKQAGVTADRLRQVLKSISG